MEPARGEPINPFSPAAHGQSVGVKVSRVAVTRRRYQPHQGAMRLQSNSSRARLGEADFDLGAVSPPGRDLLLLPLYMTICRGLQVKKLLGHDPYRRNLL